MVGGAWIWVIVPVFAGIMALIMKVVNKIQKDKEKSGNVKPETKKAVNDVPHKKSFFQKYCNEQKNDSRKALAHYILIHEEGERKDRGQQD
ncbi:MAG: hypothetical protein RSC31_01900 [Anaerovoracaceae bacterium]